MSLRYRCDRCGAEAGAEEAVGWVEVRPLGGHLLHPPEPHHLCRLCWARLTDADVPAPPPADGEPQLSEHTQSRDLGQ
ncbi:hypothetical protein [Modestobacter sp. NPDC049651]|uniref:hypothetical protein n=1 Tax=unclassified Modestobacter TaxID=2643866 RepID=UPI0033DAAF73